jgi:tRNA (guanine26-N2/guanine27-N2)-dimethyltransferase
MKLKKIQEGKVNLFAPIGRIYDTPVFYNPEMELSRDISVSALQVFQKQFKKKLNICDALAATGVRGLRYAKEVSNLKEIILNDKNPIAVKIIRKNIKENRLSKKCKAKKEDANVLLHQKVFNFIDIDPFGSPNIFLDSVARSIYHKGFLAITATDTAPLAGTYPLACLKKYGILSMKTDYYAELGMRILISHIILTLSRRERAFIPLLVHSTRHYYRVFGKIEHLGKIRNLLKNFGYVMDCKCGNREQGELKEKCYCGKKFRIIGPVYLGNILDKKFCKKVLADIRKRDFRLKKEEEKLLKLLIEESNMPAFYYDLHYLAKILKIEIPKTEVLIEKLKKKGFKATRTHFCLTAIKTDANFKQLRTILL